MDPVTKTCKAEGESKCSLIEHSESLRQEGEPRVKDSCVETENLIENGKF